MRVMYYGRHGHDEEASRAIASAALAMRGARPREPRGVRVRRCLRCAYASAMRGCKRQVRMRAHEANASSPPLSPPFIVAIAATGRH
jgi:hypothetical protein